ncbi:MAG: DegV family protein [Christensenellales bacterium]|jgi:DegV family protein with EDD domain
MDNTSKIAVITDSCSDLNDELLKEHNISMVSMRIVFRDGEYRDRVDITADEVYKKMEHETPKTSLPLPEEILELYDSLASQGYTDAIHICISSGLSGTYNMLRLLAEGYERMRVHVLDTKTLSMHEGYIALECAKAAKETNDVKKILERAQQVRDSGYSAFVIPTLEYLRKGGRIGLVAGTIGSLLKLKPVIYVNDDGVYQTHAKHPRLSAMIDAMVKEFSSRFAGKKINLSIIHGSACEEARKLLDKLKHTLSIIDGRLVQVTPVLGVHTGPGLLGIAAYEV